MFNEFIDHKGIIYKITNLINGKSYIGQTIYNFNKRYKKGKWWKYTNNRYLKNSVKKYGFENFSVKVLEYDKTLEELNVLEEKYADLYKTYVPNGYNLTHCGKNKIKHQKSLDLYTKEIVLNSPEGENIKIKNITKFCRDNGLDLRSLYRVISKKFNSHKGWSLENNTNKIFKNKHKYRFYDQNGEEYDIIGLTDFCKEKKLKYHSMRDMVQGKISTSQGYALSKENFKRRKKMYVIVLQKGDKIITLENIRRDCQKYNLHSRYLYYLISKRLNSYLGWKLKELKLR